MNKWSLYFIIFFSVFITVVTQAAQTQETSTSISSNPAADTAVTGNGALQDYIEKTLDIKNNYGFRFGGMLLGDANKLFSGGIPYAKHWTGDELFLFNVTLDTEKMGAWKDGLFGAQYLQLDAQQVNQQAGSIEGYNSIVAVNPIRRSELYQFWYRQELFDKKLIVRIGKSVPTIDFGNVIRPVPLTLSKDMPSLTGLIYTPIFINSSQLGVTPGYYNSAYGVTVNFVPVKSWYLRYGVYDGNLARGIQTGLKVWPTLNGSYFHIAETSAAWLLKQNSYPGKIGVGGWYEDGLVRSGTLKEKNTSGVYFFGSQRLWYKYSENDFRGISGFYQYGINFSNVLPVNQYVGGGLTAFGLIPKRDVDSMGVGASLGWLNKRNFSRATELMYQAYYQAQIMNGFYIEPAATYIPTPGAGTPAAWTGTLRALLLF
ncbi:carbohydrate porin [Legionella sp. PATHC038]|uniref:carbohydrate porin n=1 Tax=Legionella sheltonii TaxID=2992041 RepID=UPI00224480A1|nr:carbohydrate porin [Legionella sp. PATHC038]MCW8400470.1 carbohydrate porin [Legionella sp. PATHC038]